MVVCRVPPLAPVTVIVWLPVVARRPTVIVMLVLPAPVIVVVPKLTEFWLPSPEADSVIGESKPPVALVVIVTCPELLRAIEIVLGLALTEKPAVVPVTVSVYVVVSTMLPDVPVIVIGYVPGVTVDPTVIVMLVDPAPVRFDPNSTVIPVGCPDADKLMVESNPSDTVLVTVVDPPLPWAIDPAFGEADNVNPGLLLLPPASAPIRLAVGLPHPVTRS